MVNPTGRNGWGSKQYPSDDVLQETLLKYSRQGLKQEDKLTRLCIDVGLDIKKSKLNQLERRLGIPSVRRPGLTQEAIVQAVVDEAEKDILQNNGPNYIKSKLKDRDIKVPRDMVRAVMRQEFPDSAARRFPGQKKIARVNCQGLSTLGPYHEVSRDGHEKLATVGHVFLDLIEVLGGAPLQLNVDKGSEIGWQVAMQIVLRLKCLNREMLAPEIDPQVYKAYALLKNIPYHRHLFYWIFVPLIQAELDEFRTYWNQRTVHDQNNKYMPSGHVPNDAAEHPQLFGSVNCLISVPQNVIDDLHNHLVEEVGVTQEECRRFFPDEFGEIASDVWSFIGSLALSLHNAWMVFSKMASILESQY